MKMAGRTLTIRVPLTIVKTITAKNSIGDSKKTRINAGKYKSGSGIQRFQALFSFCLIFILTKIGIIFSVLP
jgi:hypothetical protein